MQRTRPSMQLDKLKGPDGHPMNSHTYIKGQARASSGGTYCKVAWILPFSSISKPI